MSVPEKPSHASRKELRQAVLRMRLEMHRQEIRREALQIAQPIKQLSNIGSTLRQGSSSVLLTGGAMALAAMAGGRHGWRRWLRIALMAAPLLRRLK